MVGIRRVISPIGARERTWPWPRAWSWQASATITPKYRFGVYVDRAGKALSGSLFGR
jgi:hypothetical protein